MDQSEKLQIVMAAAMLSQGQAGQLEHNILMVKKALENQALWGKVVPPAPKH